jgi:hypothetical protein
LEYWNIGKIGFGILECWANGIIVLAIKQKWIISFKIPTIPSFHYSMIEASSQISKILNISIEL